MARGGATNDSGIEAVPLFHLLSDFQSAPMLLSRWSLNCALLLPGMAECCFRG